MKYLIRLGYFPSKNDKKYLTSILSKCWNEFSKTLLYSAIHSSQQFRNSKSSI